MSANEDAKTNTTTQAEPQSLRIDQMMQVSAMMVGGLIAHVGGGEGDAKEWLDLQMSALAAHCYFLTINARDKRKCAGILESVVKELREQADQEDANAAKDPEAPKPA